MHNILILGGGGFIGNNVLRYMDKIDFLKIIKSLLQVLKNHPFRSRPNKL